MSTHQTSPIILIADKDAASRAMVRQVLKICLPEVTVKETEDAQQDLDWFREEKILVFIIDPRLEVGSGLALLQTIPTLPPEQRPQHVLVVSPLFNAKTQEHSTKHLHFLAKPLQDSVLREYFSLIQTLGKPSSLPPAAASPAARVKAKTDPKPRLDTHTFMVFREGLVYVLSALAEIQGRHRLTSLRKFQSLSGEIGAVIDLNCTLFQGQLVFSMSEAAYLQFASAVLKEKVTKVDAAQTDCLSELANQVYGYAKRELNNLGFGFELAIPRVIRGKNCHFPPGGKGDILFCSEYEMESANVLTMEIQISRFKTTQPSHQNISRGP